MQILPTMQQAKIYFLVPNGCNGPFFPRETSQFFCTCILYTYKIVDKLEFIGVNQGRSLDPIIHV